MYLRIPTPAVVLELLNLGLDEQRHATLPEYAEEPILLSASIVVCSQILRLDQNRYIDMSSRV